MQKSQKSVKDLLQIMSETEIYLLYLATENSGIKYNETMDAEVNYTDIFRIT